MVAVTNPNRGVMNSYTHDPFGVTTETKATVTNLSNPWRYAGQYFDTATGCTRSGLSTTSRSWVAGPGRTGRVRTPSPTPTWVGTQSTSWTPAASALLASSMTTSPQRMRTKQTMTLNIATGSLLPKPQRGRLQRQRRLYSYGPTAYKYGYACVDGRLRGLGLVTFPAFPKLSARPLVAVLVP